MTKRNLLRPLRPVDPKWATSNSFGRPGDYSAGYHTGVDYAVPLGTPVRSPRAGTITDAGYNGDYGNYVVIRAWGGRKAFFLAHLSRIKVREGQKVKRGQIVGLSGDTGNSTGPHLHAEQRHAPFGYWDHEKPGWE